MMPATIMKSPPSLAEPDLLAEFPYLAGQSFESCRGGCRRSRFNSGDFFLKASTRAADSLTRWANLRLLSASWIRAS